MPINTALADQLRGVSGLPRLRDNAAAKSRAADYLSHKAQREAQRTEAARLAEEAASAKIVLNAIAGKDAKPAKAAVSQAVASWRRYLVYRSVFDEKD